MYTKKNKGFVIPLIILIIFGISMLFVSNIYGATNNIVYNIQNDWGNGATVSVTIENTDTINITNWNLSWTFSENQKIENMWNGSFIQNGNSVTVTNIGWNSIISPGNSVNFGFNISYGSSNSIPDNFTLSSSSSDTTLSTTETSIITPTPTSLPTAASTIYTGNITYTLEQVSNPTPEQLSAYQKIAEAMDIAVSYYNQYTNITKQLYITYNPSVPTADGNINGSIRFGSEPYMNYITAMHEISHTVGVGTSGNWSNLIQSGIYIGPNATNMLRELTGDNSAEIHGDRQHFWPYGLNYTSEVSSERDVINHCKIVNAMKKDGL